MMDKRTMRSFKSDFLTREDGEDLYVEGYFAVFNTIYQLWQGATETIKPGAFTSCIGQDVRALINHDATLVLGRTKSNTLELKQDERGLWGRIKINKEDSDAMNLYTRVKRGDVDQCSFGFDTVKEETEYEEDGSVRWIIEEVNPLYEVSCCTFPAYEDTSIYAREKDFETIKKRKIDEWKERSKTRLKGGK